MIVHPASPEDSIDIWTWRNNKKTQDMFLNQNAVSWNSHKDWFEKSLLNPDRYMYIGYTEKKEKIGICRFDKNLTKNTAEVSINLNPTMRNKKLSHPFLGACIVIFFYHNKIPLTAKIKNENIASINCFEKSGFILQREDETFKYYIL